MKSREENCLLLLQNILYEVIYLKLFLKRLNLLQFFLCIRTTSNVYDGMVIDISRYLKYALEAMIIIEIDSEFCKSDEHFEKL